MSSCDGWLVDGHAGRRPLPAHPDASRPQTRTAPGAARLAIGFISTWVFMWTCMAAAILRDSSAAPGSELPSEATWRTQHRTFVCCTRGPEVAVVVGLLAAEMVSSSNGTRRAGELIVNSSSWIRSNSCLYPLHRILICAFLHDLHFAVDRTRNS
jgi:hypothetical protein